jgi:hypothetical protein
MAADCCLFTPALPAAACTTAVLFLVSVLMLQVLLPAFLTLQLLLC